MFFTKGYAQQAKVLTLGVFHFEFPNLDTKQYSDDEQIDVWLPRYQKEILSSMHTFLEIINFRETNTCDLRCRTHESPKLFL